MTKLTFLLFLITLTVNAQTEIELSLSKANSRLVWTGSPLVGPGHRGTIQFVKGAVTLQEDVITGGEFVLDMNTIVSTDLKPEQGAKDLTDHLKSDDFFSVGKFPNASFVIQKITPVLTLLNPNQYSVTGLLTIKGITRQVNFLATIEGLKVDAKFTIDRTKWDVIHHSKSIFADLKDGIISDEILISLSLRFGGC